MACRRLPESPAPCFQNPNPGRCRDSPQGQSGCAGGQVLGVDTFVGTVGGESTKSLSLLWPQGGVSGVLFNTTESLLEYGEAAS